MEPNESDTPRPAGLLGLGLATPSTGLSPPLFPTEPPRIPDHEILKRIGRGAFGEVWLARTVMGAYRAVKVVSRRTFEHPRPYERELEGIRRFEPVSRRHESQVAILQVGRDDEAGHFYYVMELADDASAAPEPTVGPAGDTTPLPWKQTVLDPERYLPRTLRHELHQRGRLSVEETLRMGLSLTTALEHLHRHGLVHRDIKPSNIIFVDAVPKLADVGLVSTQDASMSMVGTPGFIPPEGAGTPQGDLYSLGKVLYEMCTGRDRAEFPRLPPELLKSPEGESLLELNAVLVKACQANPRHRYRSAVELHADLAMIRGGRSVRRSHWLERRQALLIKIAVGAVVVAMLASGAWLVQRQVSNRIRAEQENLTRHTYATDLQAAYRYYFQDQDVGRARQLLKAHVPQRLEEDLRGWEWRYLWRQCRGDALFRLPQNPEWPRSVDFVDGGKVLAVAGFGGGIDFWDVATHRAVAQLREALWSPSGAASADGRLLATCGTGSDGKGVVKIWDVRGRRRVTSWEHTSPFTSVALAPPEGRRVAATSSDGSLWIWELSGERLRLVRRKSKLLQPMSLSDRGYALAFSRNASLLAVGDETGQIWLIDPATGEHLFPPVAVRHPIPPGLMALAFSPDGAFLASAATYLDYEVKISRLPGLEPVASLTNHADWISSLRFSPDGRTLASASADQTVRLWDTGSWQLAATLLGHANEVSALSYSPDGGMLASVGRDGEVLVWDAKPGALRHAANGQAITTVTNFAFSSDSQSLALVLTDRTVALASVTNAIQQIPFPAAGSNILRACFSPDGRALATVDTRGQVRILDLKNRLLVKSFPAHTNRVTLLTYIDRGKSLATYAAGEGLHVWNTGTWERRRTFADPAVTSGFIMSPNFWGAAAVSRDGRMLATGHAQTVRLLDLSGVHSPRFLPAHMSSAWALAFSADGRRLASCSNDGLVKLWELGSGVWDQNADLTPRRYRAHRHGVLGLAFSPDGKRLAAASLAWQGIKLLGLSTWQELASLRVPEAATFNWRLEFSPDGQTLGVLAADVLHLWHAPSLEEIEAFEGAPTEIAPAAREE